MNQQNPIVIVGAGAAGLMAGWELAKAGKRVVILESRERLGGRIWPLPEQDFGYPAEGGAEFVHGEAKLTRALIETAGLHFVPMEGDAWHFENDQLVKGFRGFPHEDLLIQKLNELEIDVSVVEFLELHFSGERFRDLRKSVLNFVKGYDAADPARASAFTLRAELSGQDGNWQQGRIREGYGALMEFLARECRANGCEIEFNCQVKAIDHHTDERQVHSADGKVRAAQEVILTIPLPLIPLRDFSPPLPQEIDALREIGYGNVIKLIMRFQSRWWVQAGGEDLERLSFLFSDEVIPTWWTQFPEAHATLTGWIGGPNTESFKGRSSEDVVETAFGVLSRCLKTPEKTIREHCVGTHVMDWSTDPFARGAYSYATVKSQQARREFMTSSANSIFFAGEAFAEGVAASTVEGALASGRDVARRILAR